MNKAPPARRDFIHLARDGTQGFDAANRDVFRAEPAETPDLVGLAVYGPKKQVDKTTKGAKLHP